MALEPEDRTEEIIPPTKNDLPVRRTMRKEKGECRMVVEFPFHFTKEFLREESDRRGVNLIDGVDYLREIKKRFESGEINLTDLATLSSNWSDNGIRVEAAK